MIFFSEHWQSILFLIHLLQSIHVADFEHPVNCPCHIRVNHSIRISNTLEKIKSHKSRINTIFTPYPDRQPFLTAMEKLVHTARVKEYNHTLLPRQACNLWSVNVKLTEEPETCCVRRLKSLKLAVWEGWRAWNLLCEKTEQPETCKAWNLLCGKAAVWEGWRAWNLLCEKTEEPETCYVRRL